jgi:hypothetical protein
MLSSAVKKAAKDPVKTATLGLGPTSSVNLNLAGDAYKGLTGYDELQAAQKAQGKAQRQAIAAQEDMYMRGLEAMAPYRAYGQAALPGLIGSLQPGSELGTMRSRLGQQYAPQALASKGFDPAVIDELMGKYNAAMGVQEETARMNRAQDIMNLGMGSAVQGAGMAGQQGRGLAQSYLQGAQMQGQMAQQQALARRNAMMGLMYGGYRGLMDYAGGAYE